MKVIGSKTMVVQVLARAQGQGWRRCPWWWTGFQGPQLVCWAGQLPPPGGSWPSQRVCQTRSEWSRRAFGNLASALEMRRDLMSSFRQGHIPAARPPVWLNKGALALEDCQNGSLLVLKRWKQERIHDHFLDGRANFPPKADHSWRVGKRWAGGGVIPDVAGMEGALWGDGV